MAGFFSKLGNIVSGPDSSLYPMSEQERSQLGQGGLIEMGLAMLANNNSPYNPAGSIAKGLLAGAGSMREKKQAYARNKYNEQIMARTAQGMDRNNQIEALQSELTKPDGSLDEAKFRQFAALDPQAAKAFRDAVDPQTRWQLGRIGDGQGGEVDVLFDPMDPSKIRTIDGQPIGGMLGNAPQEQAPQFGITNQGGGVPAAAGPMMGQAFYDAVGGAIGPYGGTVGSTSGGEHNPGSLHYDGRALDIPMGASASAEAKANAGRMVADLQNRGYTVRDERARPAGQAVWGGPHLHVEAPGGEAPRPTLGRRPKVSKSDDGMGTIPAGYRLAADGQSLEAVPGGPADRKNNPLPADQAKDERQMRQELSSLNKEDLGVVNAYQRVEAAARQPSAAGDLSLIFGYMKMLDPGSVVREGEFANAQNAAGIPDRISNLYNNALKGERLNPNQREQFVTEAKKLHDQSRARVANRTIEYADIASQYGYDPVRATGQKLAAPEARAKFNQAGDLLKQARDAIMRGAPKDAVKQRLIEQGFSNIAGRL